MCSHVDLMTMPLACIHDRVGVVEIDCRSACDAVLTYAWARTCVQCFSHYQLSEFAAWQSANAEVRSECDVSVSSAPAPYSWQISPARCRAASIFASSSITAILQSILCKPITCKLLLGFKALAKSNLPGWATMPTPSNKQEKAL